MISPTPSMSPMDPNLSDLLRVQMSLHNWSTALIWPLKHYWDKHLRGLEPPLMCTCMSSPRRTFPERSRWTRLLGMDGLAHSDWQRLFTPNRHTQTHTHKMSAPSPTINPLLLQLNIKGNSKGNDQKVQTGNVGIRIWRKRPLSLSGKFPMFNLWI